MNLHREINAVPVLALAGIAAVATVGAWALATRSSRVSHWRRSLPLGWADEQSLRVERTVTVMRPADELYAIWRDLARLPELMPHLESVTPLDGTRSRWTIRGPGHTRLTWEAELVADEPGRLISWRSVDGADVDNEGSVSFAPAPGGRGTEVKVMLRYAPPAGTVGGALGTFLGQGGDQRVREDLRHFKQRIETGEVARASATEEQ
jgi:uncharacterized membrane protein